MAVPFFTYRSSHPFLPRWSAPQTCNQSGVQKFPLIIPLEIRIRLLLAYRNISGFQSLLRDNVAEKRAKAFRSLVYSLNFPSIPISTTSSTTNTSNNFAIDAKFPLRCHYLLGLSRRVRMMLPYKEYR